MAIPPPDVPYDLPKPCVAADTYLLIVGFLHAEPDVEVFARSGDEMFRFYLPKHSRVVRDFWKQIGVTNVLKLQEGVYQDTRGSCGPYTMSGMVIGEDHPLPDEEPVETDVPSRTVAEVDTSGEAPMQRAIGTKVIIAVKLED